MLTEPPETEYRARCASREIGKHKRRRQDAIAEISTALFFTRLSPIRIDARGDYSISLK